MGRVKWGLEVGLMKAGTMRQAEVTTLKILRNYLVKKGGMVKTRRFAGQDIELCRRLDETLLGFRVARQAVKNEPQGSCGFVNLTWPLLMV